MGPQTNKKIPEQINSDQVAELFKRPVPQDKKDHLYVYAIARTDIEMPPGKLSAQTGHAYTDSLVNALEIKPDAFYSYRNPSKGGSKVTLRAKNQNQLIKAYNLAIDAGIPCALVVDQDHVLPPHFDGSPIITALGIGPCTKEESRHIVKKFRCI